MRWLTGVLVVLALACATGVGAERLASGAAVSWRLSQDPDHPWQGTPRTDISDHRNGAALAGAAIFSDPRWAARAIAIELRDYHRAGARSAQDYADRLATSCEHFGGSTCAHPEVGPALAAAGGSGLREDLRLFDGRDLPTSRFPAMLTALSKSMGAEPPSTELLEVARSSVAHDDLDQTEAGFKEWRLRDPERAAAVAGLEAGLAERGVSGVVPVWQLLRTGSDWRGCGAPFEVPPPEVQAAIAPTLALVREKVGPVLGPFEAKSAYRGPWLNICAGGAERSAHRDFSAVDLVPLTPMTRHALMAKLCPVYARDGEAERLGLGFYAGVRFHVDTWRHRSWASENGRAYAPCAADGGVNPPLPPLPKSEILPPAPPSR